MSTRYRIQARDSRGEWTYDVGDPVANRFDSEEGASDAILELRRLGDEWATAEYRVVQIDG